MPSSVSWPSTPSRTGTPGKTSAMRSRLGRCMTVSPAAMTNASAPAMSASRAGREPGAAYPVLEAEPAALRDVRLVDVAPQIPLAQARVVPVRGELRVVLALHDVREAQADDRDAAPAVELARHLLAEHLRQRVARLRA